MRFGAMAAAWLVAGVAVAQAPMQKPERGDLTAPDYRQPANWICRPGVDDGTCSTNLDAMAIDAAGTRTPAPYRPAAAPPIDCFYIYPTTSNDPTIYSDLSPGAEEKRATHAQAARLSEQCRLFVPVYHSFTLTALHWALAGHAADVVDFDPPYRDVLAAWRDYLARDNKGRGVVIVAHSQGSILAKRLIAEEVDGKPAQKLLVAAYLAGNLDLTAKSFKAIKPCAAPDQSGCVVAWSSYVDKDPDAMTGARFYGNGKPGDPALCVNPAAVAGGRGMLKTYLSKPAIAPAADPPCVETIGQISAECVTDAVGSVLRVRTEPGRYQPLLDAALKASGAIPSWGLHTLDINLVQGNMIDLIAQQSAAWRVR